MHIVVVLTIVFMVDMRVALSFTDPRQHLGIVHFYLKLKQHKYMTM